MSPSPNPPLPRAPDVNGAQAYALALLGKPRHPRRMTNIPYFDANAVRRLCRWTTASNSWPKPRPRSAAANQPPPARVPPGSRRPRRLGGDARRNRFGLRAKLIALYPHTRARAAPQSRASSWCSTRPQARLPRPWTAPRSPPSAPPPPARATRALAREDACVLALLGYGVQAETHLEAMRCVRPVGEVRVWVRASPKRNASPPRTSTTT